MTLTIILVGAIILLFAFVVFYGAPYVPSRKKYINEAFDELYRLGSKDVLVDFGSGDGVVLRQAAKRGSRAVGYELNPVLVLLSRILSRKQNKVEVKLASYWNASLPNDTTIVYIFSVQRDSYRMGLKIQEESNRLNRPLNVMCYGSPLSKKPDATIRAYTLYTFHPLQSTKA